MKKNGKTSVFINSNNYLNASEDANYKFGPSTRIIPDLIRYLSRNYWSGIGDTIQPADRTNSNIDIEYIDNNIINLKANKKYYFEDKIDENGILQRSFSPDEWSRLINEHLIPSYKYIYEDNYYKIPELVNIAENKDTKISGLNYINYEFIYNFNSKNYESLVNDTSTDVTVLPSINSLINDPRMSTITRDEKISLTLGGLIPDNYVGSLYTRNNIESIKKYFDIYPYYYNKEESILSKQYLKSLPIDINLNKESIKYLKTINTVPFPFYTSIELTNFADKSEDFLHNLGDIKEDLRSFLISNQLAQTNNYIKNSSTVEEHNLKEYNFLDWINTQLSGSTGQSETNNFYAFDRATKTFNSVEYTNLIKDIKNKYSTKKRQYKDFMSKDGFVDFLYYKIEKRQYKYNSPNILQSFWITPDDSEYIRYIDTQIKYGSEYFYTVKAFFICMGNKYSYDDYYGNDELQKQKDINSGNFKVKIINQNTYKILEIPLINFNGAVYELPPTKPNIKFAKDNSNIKIILESPEQQNLEKINILNSKEFEKIEKIRLSQYNTDIEKIYSKINKDADLEIFRITDKPINYLSFDKKLYKRLKIKDINSVSDTVLANIKYYYLFRYINSHDIPSNFSKIFEVELKDIDGYQTLNVEQLDFEYTPELVENKNFKRYLLVRPSVIQTKISTNEEILSPYDITLGPDRQKTWDKKFILRITSKKSNRVIELNITPTIIR